MIKDGSLVSWTWFVLALVLFAIEAFRPGRFALWLGFAAILVGIVASVALAVASGGGGVPRLCRAFSSGLAAL